jgi:predicted GNAT family acetyltransferase
MKKTEETIMLFQKLNESRIPSTSELLRPITSFSQERICRLTVENKEEVIRFLNVRPVHTVVMASFIHDNNFDADLDRGKFYGYRGIAGDLEGVALIGHSTLIEARSEQSMAAFAFKARTERVSINLIMAEHDDAQVFWSYYAGTAKPRLSCTELLFETAFPMMVLECDWQVRTARADEIEQIAVAHAEVAFIETGTDPMLRDPDGFRARIARRIDMGRTYVVFESGKLVFKADIIAEADGIAYLEGIYVAPEYRGKGVGSKCLSRLNMMLLERFETVCMLSNERFTDAHRCFGKAGFRSSGRCTTLFV